MSREALKEVDRQQATRAERAKRLKAKPRMAKIMHAIRNQLAMMGIPPISGTNA